MSLWCSGCLQTVANRFLSFSDFPIISILPLTVWFRYMPLYVMASFNLTPMLATSLLFRPIINKVTHYPNVLDPFHEDIRGMLLGLQRVNARIGSVCCENLGTFVLTNGCNGGKHGIRVNLKTNGRETQMGLPGPVPSGKRMQHCSHTFLHCYLQSPFGQFQADVPSPRQNLRSQR
jgi:hypothetical protein